MAKVASSTQYVDVEYRGHSYSVTYVYRPRSEEINVQSIVRDRSRTPVEKSEAVWEKVVDEARMRVFFESL